MLSGIGKYARSAATAMVACATLFSGTPTVSTPAVAAERPVAPEKNPPGDIPDTQAFVTYTSPLGFSLKVPEGWARTDRPAGASFSDKYNVIDVTVATAADAPTTTSVTQHEAADLVKAGRAVRIEAIRQVMLRSGPAVMVVYTSNSEPNPVTNKRVRLENQRYLIYRRGKLATLDLSAPLGADNADQWTLMSNSFHWR